MLQRLVAVHMKYLTSCWADGKNSKGKRTRNQIAKVSWIREKAREFQKNIYFCFIDYTKTFDCVAQNKLWKILKEIRIPDHLTCLLRNLYAGQETTVRADMEQQTGSKSGMD